MSLDADERDAKLLQEVLREMIVLVSAVFVVLSSMV